MFLTEDEYIPCLETGESCRRGGLRCCSGLEYDPRTNKCLEPVVMRVSESDMLLTRDDDDTCQEVGEVCNDLPGPEECCSGLECERPRGGSYRCCKPRGERCSDDTECCDGYCEFEDDRGECRPRGRPKRGDVDVKQMVSFKGLGASNVQSVKAVFLTEDEDSTCLEIGEECGPQAPYPNNFMQCCVGHCLSNTRKCCTMGECSDWSGICGSNGLCTQR